MNATATIEQPPLKQRTLAFASASRFNARQFDLAALEGACSIIPTCYHVARSYMDRNVKDMSPPAHYEPPCVAAWQLAIADHALGLREPSQDLTPLILDQVAYERALLVKDDLLWRGYVPQKLFQYLLLGHWEPAMTDGQLRRVWRGSHG